MNGNSLYEVRYGYVCKTQDLIENWPSCSNCYKKIKKNLIDNSTSWDKCLRWDIMSYTRLPSTKPPIYYTKNVLEHNMKLKPIKVNWSYLIEIIETTSESYTTVQWSETNVRSFLST